MDQQTVERPSGKQLVRLGFSKAYAYELARGEKTPSLAKALLIQEQTGYPVTAWRRTA